MQYKIKKMVKAASSVPGYSHRGIEYWSIIEDEEYVIADCFNKSDAERICSLLNNDETKYKANAV